MCLKGQRSATTCCCPITSCSVIALCCSQAFNTMMTHTAAGCAAGLVLPARAPSHPTRSLVRNALRCLNWWSGAVLSPRALNSLRLGSFVGMFTSLEHGMMYARGEADVFNSSFSGLVTGSCFAAASMRHAASCVVHLTGPLGAASRNGQTIGRYGAIGCMLVRACCGQTSARVTRAYTGDWCGHAIYGS